MAEVWEGGDSGAEGRLICVQSSKPFDRISDSNSDIGRSILTNEFAVFVVKFRLLAS